MNKKNLKKYLVESRALLRGHFLLSSGLHSPDYVQCALALKNPSKAVELGETLKRAWKGPRPDLILSPAMGGLIIGHETAKAFKRNFIFAERKNGILALRRSFNIKRKAKVLIVEDVVTTGKSSLETAGIIRERGAEFIGVLSIINRTGRKNPGFPLESAIELKLKTFKPGHCPLCRKNIPLVKPGSRGLS